MFIYGKERLEIKIHFILFRTERWNCTFFRNDCENEGADESSDNNLSSEIESNEVSEEKDMFV